MNDRPSVLRRIRPWHLADLFAVILLFTGLGAPPLLDPDGSRYPEVAREMLERGDWITPTQNYVPFFHKPPLMYWMLMLSLSAFGETEFAARLVPTVCAVAGMAVAWWLAAITVGRRAARWAPAILATTLLYFIHARLASTDMLLSVALAAALTAWWSAHKSRRVSLARLALAGVLLGLAILSKGPVALVLFMGAVGVYLVWSRRLSTSAVSLGVPVLAGVVVAAPWFIVMQARNPEFASYFFIFQNFQRFTAIGYIDHPHPWYWLLPIALGGALMWSALWPFGLSGWRRRWRDISPDQRDSVRFLVSWAGFVLLFFSLSRCKLAPYILPMFPPLAVASAAAARRALSASRPSVWLRATLLTPAAAAIGILVFLTSWAGHQTEIAPGRLQHAMTSCAILMLPAVLAFVTAQVWRDAEKRFAALAVGAALFLMALLPLFHADVAERKMSGVLPDKLVADARRGEWTLAEYECYNASLCFYTRHRVVLIDFVGLEMVKGPKQPDGAYWFRDDEAAIDELAEEGPLALWVKTKVPADFAQRHGLTQVAANRERLLLVNDAGLAKLGMR
ncbi:MAG: glycosyltransferase family 39 protein [Armatimonadetes bacterium]|nr:glycosyltransferase family 39 protein [Armatimonadota bacterium]